MPKKIISRSSLGFTNIHIDARGGHNQVQNLNEFAQDVINYTSNELNNNLIKNNNVSIQQVPSVNLPSNLNVNIPTTIYSQNVDVFNEITEEITIPTIPEEEIELMYNDFVSPYLEAGPYKLPAMSQFTRLINLIDAELVRTEGKPRYKLDLFRGILDALVRGRSTYFYDLQLESEAANLRKKMSELEELVSRYASELALCNGTEEGVFTLGCVGIKLNKPKNLIYAQALLNINMAWYLYLYNTKKVEYDKYYGVIQFVNEKGKQAAYDELIALLDEKYKDHEHEIHDSCETSGSSQDNSSAHSDCDNSSECGSTSSSDKCKDDSLEFLVKQKEPGKMYALVVEGALCITQIEKLNKTLMTPHIE